MRETVIVLDFGGQYNQLIARRVRDLNVYAEILPNDASLERIQEYDPIGIIFTGGPSTVTDESAPRCDERIFSCGIPVLGICYGSQLMGSVFGGSVKRADHREYGKTDIEYETSSPLFKDLEKESVCWMSHTYYVDVPPKGFDIIATTKSCPVARRLGILIESYMAYSSILKLFIQSFVRKSLATSYTKSVKQKAAGTMDNYVDTAIEEIRRKVGDGRVLLALSGGVDSSVAAVLLDRAIGKKAHMYIRRPRVTAQGRSKAGRGNLLRRVRYESHLCRCIKAFP